MLKISRVKSCVKSPNLPNFVKNEDTAIKKRGGTMETKQNHLNHLFQNVNAFSENLIQRIRKNLTEEYDEYTGETIIPGSEKHLNLKNFVTRYNESYTRLKEKANNVLIDMGAATLDLTETIDQKREEYHRISQAVERIKHEVMTPTYERLGPQVIEASQSAERLVELMRDLRVKCEEFRQIVRSFARWHVLDDVQKQLQPHAFASCFASFKANPHAGHPMENLYELADKARLHQTLEALHQERYRMTLTHGWTVSKERTKQFLLAFMLSLYRNPLDRLYGKMAAFHRFFTDDCGYSFAPVKRTLQHWLDDYRDFVNERTRRHNRLPQNEPDKSYRAWLRRVKKYRPLEELVAWMGERLPQYGWSVA